MLSITDSVTCIAKSRKINNDKLQPGTNNCSRWNKMTFLATLIHTNVDSDKLSY